VLERPFRGHLAQPPAVSRDISNQVRVLRAPSSLAWNASWGGASTASLGNLGQGLNWLFSTGADLWQCPTRNHLVLTVLDCRNILGRISPRKPSSIMEETEQLYCSFQKAMRRELAWFLFQSIYPHCVNKLEVRAFKCIFTACFGGHGSRLLSR